LLNLRQLLPDEMIDGYVGHLLATNVIENVKALTTRLAGIDGCMPNDVTTRRVRLGKATIIAASLASGVTRERIYRHHTFRPLVGLFLPSLNRGPERVSEWKLCRYCVEEDLTFWGTSYWRRLHQVTGITWCLKHGTSLLRYGARRGVLASPSEALKGAAPNCATFCDSWRTPTVERYAAIAVALLENGQGTLSAPRIARLLRHQLLQRMHLFDQTPRRLVSDSLGGRQWLLSDLPRGDLPQDWLSHYFGSSFSPSGERQVAPIDGLILGFLRHISVFHLTVVMALLWDNEVDAANDLLRAGRVQKCSEWRRSCLSE
jgi:hypothetical protein